MEDLSTIPGFALYTIMAQDSSLKQFLISAVSVTPFCKQTYYVYVQKMFAATIS